MSTQKVKFVLAAEIVADASTGLLLGEFNNWDKESGFSLKKGKDGTMEATVALEAGRSYQYRYLLDGGRWENDHRADGYLQVEGHDVYNCVVHVPVAEALPTKAANKTVASKPKNAGKKIDLPAVDAAEKATAKVKALTTESATEKKAKPVAKESVKAAVKKQPETKSAAVQKAASKSASGQKAESKVASKAAAPAAPKKTSKKGK